VAVLEGSATIFGSTIAIQTASGQTFAVVEGGGQMQTVPITKAPAPVITPPPVVFEGITVEAVQSPTAVAFAVSDQTLSLGGSVTVARDASLPIHFATDATGKTILIAGDQTTTIETEIQPTTITIAGVTLTPHPPAFTDFLIDGQALAVGKQLTLARSTETFQLQTDAAHQTILLANWKTKTLPAPPPTAPFTINGVILTPLFSTQTVSAILVNGHSLTVGSSITVTASERPDLVLLTLTTDEAGHTLLVAPHGTATLTTDKNGALAIETGVRVVDAIASILGLESETSNSPSVGIKYTGVGPVPTLTSREAKSVDFCGWTFLIIMCLVACLGY
jgi:hypothetical protein